jgi:hypothetical protein
MREMRMILTPQSYKVTMRENLSFGLKPFTVFVFPGPRVALLAGNRIEASSGNAKMDITPATTNAQASCELMTPFFAAISVSATTSDRKMRRVPGYC